MLEADVHSAALVHLRVLFPQADPLYLDSLINHYNNSTHSLFSSASTSRSTSAQHASSVSSRKGKGKARAVGAGAGAGEVVNAISAKLLDMQGEYPRAAWKPRHAPAAPSASRGSARRGSASVWREMRAGASGGNHKPEPSNALDLPEMDLNLTRNHALVRLHALFPLTPVEQLRQAVLDAPHSFLFRAAETLLRRAHGETRSPPSFASFASFLGLNSRAASPAASTSSTQAGPAPALKPQDLFHSSEYEAALVNHLRREYPLVPATTVQAIVRQGGPFPIILDQVRTWRGKQGPIKNFFSDLFTSAPPPPSSQSRPLLEAGEDTCEELAAEICALEAAERADRTAGDEQLARELNEEWTPEDQRFECGCCYDDVPFEDVTTCASAEHIFCASCVARAVSEHVYGGAPLKLASPDSGPGEGSGVRCLSIEGCQAPFALDELGRVLKPTLLAALNRRLAEAALEALVAFSAARPSKDGPVKLVKCPFCAYTEQAERAPCLSRAFPLLAREHTDPLDTASDLIRSIVALSALVVLHTLAAVAVVFWPESFRPWQPEEQATSPNAEVAPAAFYPLLTPHLVLPLAHTFLDSTAQQVLATREGHATVFRCRNTPSGDPLPEFGEGAELATTRAELIEKVWLIRPDPPLAASTSATAGAVNDLDGYCGRLSCLQCQKAYVPGSHKCWENEKDGLRLAVERAMSEAVKRTCPTCGLTFTKDAGCNKMTCRCGTAMCFVCREDITVIKYQHFCQHFLPNVGVPCTECTRCSLWVNQSDEAAAARAAAHARDKWLRDHPSIGQASSIATQTIGPGGFAMHDVGGSVLHGLTELSKVVFDVILM